MHNKKKSKYKTSYFTGKLNSADHPTTGVIEINDRVRKVGTHDFGVVKRITKSNFGKGRPVAVVEWDNGEIPNLTTKEPLGRLRKE